MLPRDRLYTRQLIRRQEWEVMHWRREEWVERRPVRLDVQVLPPGIRRPRGRGMGARKGAPGSRQVGQGGQSSSSRRGFLLA